MYAGEQFDKVEGHYYLRARHYQPGIGRFIQEDSYPGKVNDSSSLNLYSYCNNDPVLCFLRGTNKNMVNSNKSVYKVPIHPNNKTLECDRDFYN